MKSRYRFHGDMRKKNDRISGITGCNSTCGQREEVVGSAHSARAEGSIHMAVDRPVHAPEAADGTAAPAVAAPLASGFAAYGGLAQMFTPPPRFLGQL